MTEREERRTVRYIVSKECSNAVQIQKKLKTNNKLKFLVKLFDEYLKEIILNQP